MAQARHPGRTVDMTNATAIQKATLLVAAVFILVGIAGFIPGITTHYGDMAFAGDESRAELFGIFQVSILHNLVHLAFGVLGYQAARTAEASRLYLLVGGAIYLLLTLYGAAVDQNGDANFVPVNTADDWLHLVLGAGMISLGVALADRPAKQRRPA